MRVDVLAYTGLSEKAHEVLNKSAWTKPADHLAEIAGRVCYDSFHRPNARTAANPDYIGNILEQQHHSVLEHASMTLHVTGASRNMLLELERHRHLSFSVRSTRYVDESECEWADVVDKTMSLDGDLTEAVETYKYLVEAYLSAGKSRKEARQAARHVLPGGIATEFVVTGNHRTWREIVQKRLSPHADVEIAEFAQNVLRLGYSVAPATYQDLWSTYDV